MNKSELDKIKKIISKIHQLPRNSQFAKRARYYLEVEDTIESLITKIVEGIPSKMRESFDEEDDGWNAHCDEVNQYKKKTLGK